MDNPKRSPAFLFGYGVGDFGLNIYWNSLSLILVFWYSDVVGLQPSEAGIIFAVGVLWDAISDPIVAFLAERNRSRYGSYRPFILFGSFLLGATFVLLFWAPPWQGAALFVHLIFVHMLFRTSYTIVAVPYSALTARITYSSRERTDLSGVRMAFAFLGLLAISSFWFPLTRFFGSGQESSAAGSFYTAMVGACVATATLIVCFLSTKEKRLLGGANELAPNFIISLRRAITKNRALRILLMLIFVNSAAGLSTSIPLAFYVEANGDTFANKEVIFTTYAVIALLSVPFWTLMIRAFSKKKCWCFASASVVLFGLHLALFGPLVIHGVPTQIVAMACGSSAFAVLTWAIIPDTVEYGQYIYGKRDEGATFGSVLFSQKVSQAVTGLFIGQILTWIGYDSVADTQSADVAERIGLFLALAPATLVLISALIVLYLPLNRATHKEMVDALSKSKSASEQGA